MDAAKVSPKRGKDAAQLSETLEISDYATDRRMETVLARERRTEFSADTFEREKQLAEIYLVGQRAADEALESCVKWLALECRERSTIAELAGISLDMMTGKHKQ